MKNLSAMALQPGVVKAAFNMSRMVEKHKLWFKKLTVSAMLFLSSVYQADLLKGSPFHQLEMLVLNMSHRQLLLQ